MIALFELKEEKGELEFGKEESERALHMHGYVWQFRNRELTFN